MYCERPSVDGYSALSVCRAWLQTNHQSEWLQCLKATFQGIDTNNDGFISVKEFAEMLAKKLPEDEVSTWAGGKG